MSGFQDLHESFCGSGEPLYWPPDIFGFCAHFAKATGAYTLHVTDKASLGAIGENAEVDGARWKSGLNRKKKVVPKVIRDAWGVVCSKRGNAAEDLKDDLAFCRAILYLLACADEACAGVGLPNQVPAGRFEVAAELALSLNGNLCKRLPSDLLRVLPKLHTPKQGLNVRSLSHHLSLCGANEVKAEWTQSRLSGVSRSKMRVKVLLAPWPLRLASNAFSPSLIQSTNGDHFGYFDYLPNSDPDAPEVELWLKRRMTEARRAGHAPDLVVFPECALDQAQWRRVAKECSSQGIALVAGVHEQTKRDRRALNAVKMRLPLALDELTQHKHHRWMIDANQIRAYSLRDALSEERKWWESIEIRDRKLHFVCMDANFTFCALVCEDLAREDPAAELVRAVGPNMVVALLSDGPQINGRWPSRYASVLAEDPGCSVLTISSLGMVERSRPGGLPVNRTIASWRDASGQYVPLDLGVNDDCLLIDVHIKTDTEWTLDGRSDGGVSTYPVLAGVHGLGNGGGGCHE